MSLHASTTTFFWGLCGYLQLPGFPVLLFVCRIETCLRRMMILKKISLVFIRGILAKHGDCLRGVFNIFCNLILHPEDCSGSFGVLRTTLSHD